MSRIGSLILSACWNGDIEIVKSLYDKHVRTLEQVGGINGGDLQVLNKALQRLERFWTDQILYRL
jgi:hypothetical protein